MQFIQRSVNILINSFQNSTMGYLFLFILFKIANAVNENSFENASVPVLMKCKGADGEVGERLTIPQQFMENGQSFTFRVLKSTEEIYCPSHLRFDYTVDLNRTGDEIESVFTPSAILMVKTESNLLYRRPNKDFCIQSFSDSLLTLSVCNMTCGGRSSELCINKCCGVHQLLGFDKTDGALHCEVPIAGHDNLHWKPPIYHDPFSKLTEDEHLTIQPNYHKSNAFLNGCQTLFSWIHSQPNFTGEYKNNLNPIRFRLLKTGDLAVCASSGKWVIFKQSTFCIDSIQNFGSHAGDLPEQSVIQCAVRENGTTDHEEYESRRSLRTIIYTIVVPFASFFLLLVIIVYTLLWDKQNVHGYTIYSYCCSLFLLYATLCAQSVISKGTQPCKFVGVALHFFFISTFCWLTAINFDVYFTFRNLKVCRESKNIRRYLMYALFSVVVPTIIIAVGLSLDDPEAFHRKSHCETDENEVSIIMPNYGLKVCGIADEAQGWYIYLPAGVLLGCNAVFFGMTVYTMHQYKQSTDAVLKGKSTKEDKPFILFSKLFIVMGVTWVLEFVGWILQQDHSVHMSSLGFIFIFDAFNLLQAVAIFYIFVCKNLIFTQLWQKYICLRPLLSVFIKCGVCQVPPDKRPSLLTQTSTIGISDGSRKLSTFSNSSQNSRKQSTASQNSRKQSTTSQNSRKQSTTSTQNSRKQSITSVSVHNSRKQSTTKV